MAKLEAKVPIEHVLENITVSITITGLIKWRVQLWIALKLFKLGAAIANINLNIKGGNYGQRTKDVQV